jgi:ATP-dependent DNA ligase
MIASPNAVAPASARRLGRGLLCDAIRGAGAVLPSHVSACCLLRFHSTMPAVVSERPPNGSGWVHEIKHDDYRLMVRRDAAGVHLLTCDVMAS